MGYKTVCRNCNKHKRIGNKGYCVNCSMVGMKQSVMEMQNKQGATYEKWCKGTIKNAEAELQRIQELPTARKPKKQSKHKGKLNKLIEKKCPSCMAYNKKSVKKCDICGFRFYKKY